MYTLKEIRKILNIQEQDRNENSWTDADAIETNEGDGKPFTPFELAILKLIHQNLTKENMEDVLRDHAYPGDVGKKWINIAKLVGLRHSLQQGHSIEDIAYDKRYVKWALDNWTEDGDYASIEKPIKVPPKRYEVDREESGSQVVFKDGSVKVIGYDEDNAADSANNQFWDWGGEMETTDYGDYDTYDSEIVDVRPLEVLSEEKQKEFNELVKLCQLGEKYTPRIVGGITRETLTQFLKENINDMVYIDEPKKKHIKKMNKPLGPLTGFPIEKFKNMPPPDNESIETEEEIDYLDSIPVEDKFVHSADEVYEHFEKFLKPKGLEFPEEDLEEVMDGVKSIILQLKYHYNRPRPYQIANAKNLKLDSEHLKSAQTPSYPSGHATQGTFIGRYLADLYPEYEKELRQIGEDIAFSRNMAKVHYPSDSELGKMLGNDLYEFVYQPEEELNEQVEESSSKYGGDKLLVPIQSLEHYGNTYLKKDLKKILTNVLECLERTCYQIGEPYFLSMIDEDGESVQIHSTCDDCTRLLDETLQALDAELIKMGFLKGNDNGMLVKPFPKEYNRWVEDIMQEINPGFFIDDNDEVSYKDLGNAYDAYYDLSEQISPEALQDLYAFHGEEFDNEMDEEVKPNTQLSGEQGNFIRTLEKLQEKRKIGDKVKEYTKKKKEDFKNFWSKLTQGAKRERKETAEAVRILGRLINNKDNVTKDDIKFLKQQSADIARIITLISLGAVSVVIPVGLEKLLNKYGISIMPKQRGKDEDGNGIDDYIDVTQDDNLLNESKQEISPVLKYGDVITILDIPTPEVGFWDDVPREKRQSYAFGEPELFKPYWVWKPSYGAPKKEGVYIIVPVDEVSELQKLGHLKPEDEGLPGHLHRKLRTIRRSRGDQWVKTNQTEPLNESKQQDLSPDLSEGDLIKVLAINERNEVTHPTRWMRKPTLFTQNYEVVGVNFGLDVRKRHYDLLPEGWMEMMVKGEDGSGKENYDDYTLFKNREAKTIYPGDVWIKTNPTQTLNESKQEFNPELIVGDFIRIYDVDKDSPIISREGYIDQDRYMMYGGDSIPEIFKVYVVMLVTKYKTTQFGREGEKMYVLMGPDMDPSRPYYIFPSHDTWVKVPKEEGLEAFKEGLESYRRMHLNESDPKKGTGKKPKGSGRRLYTDEDPSDTVSVKFRTKEDIVDTLNKSSFKSKSHKRQSQIINLIHQRVRAAHKNAKDPETKKRLKRALDYITNKKEKSKEKTKKLNKLNESTQTNQPLQRGDEVMIVDLDHSTQGYMTGRLPISLVTPETFKPYRIFGITNRRRENWEGPDADTRIYQLEPVDITDEERQQDMISSSEMGFGGGYRRGLHMIPGDTWILQKRPENWYDNLHESKQEISPRLEIGDKIKVIQIDGEHNRMPELFTTVYKVVRKRRESGRMDLNWKRDEWYDLIPAEYEGYKVFEGLVGKTIYHGDVWIKVNPTETLNESKQEISPRLEVGDKIKVIEVDEEQRPNQFGRMPNLFTTNYEVIKKGVVTLWIKGREVRKEYYDLLPEHFNNNKRDYLRKTIYNGDVWIKVNSPKEHENELGEQPNEAARTLANTRKHGIGTRFSKPAIKANPQRFRKYTRDKYLNESKQEVSPELEEGDLIKVIDTGLEVKGYNRRRERMPDIFITYKVIRKIPGGKYRGARYDLIPEKEGVVYDVSNDEFMESKSIFDGDIWIKVNPTETLNEQREPTELNPELKMGDEIMVVDVNSERESGETSYTTPPTGHKSERYIPYVVVEKNSNGHQSEWPWKYVVVEKRFLEKILKLMEEKPGYNTDWTENLIEMNAKFLYPWIYQWIKTGEFNGLSKFGLTETLNEQQFPFNPNNKNIERDHPEGEPDWSIRRGDQHYAMNVENTPNEPVAAFNNYLVKNSPFIIEGFDFYLSAVPGNMPQSAIVDVYVPRMDDSAIADDIWNKDRIYYQIAEDWYGEDASYGSKYQGRKEKLHNLDYDQKFPEFTYYEDFQDQHPEYMEYLKKELVSTNLLNEPGAQYEMIWRTKRMNLQNELDSIAKLFGVSKVLINRDPRKPWKRQQDSYGNEKIRPGKLVPREWPRP